MSEERLYLLVELPRGALLATEPKSTISRVALLETPTPLAIHLDKRFAQASDRMRENNCGSLALRGLA